MNKMTQEIIQWLKDAPFDDPEKIKNNPDISYEDWISKVKHISDVQKILINLLEENLEKDSDMAIRIIYAISWIGDQKSGPILISTLKNSDPNIRSEAIATLGRLKISTAFDQIAKCLVNKDEDVDVRANACISLGELGTPDCKKLLDEATTDSEKFIVRAAEEGIKLLNPDNNS